MPLPTISDKSTSQGTTVRPYNHIPPGNIQARLNNLYLTSKPRGEMSFCVTCCLAWSTSYMTIGRFVRLAELFLPINISMFALLGLYRPFGGVWKLTRDGFTINTRTRLLEYGRKHRSDSIYRFSVCSKRIGKHRDGHWVRVSMKSDKNNDHHREAGCVPSHKLNPKVASSL